MKGFIYSEFAELVRSRYGQAVLDKIMANQLVHSEVTAEPKARYSHEELFQMMGRLSVAVGISVNKLMETLGDYLFEKLARTYAIYFKPDQKLFEFLTMMEERTYAQVRRDDPEAILPKLTVSRLDAANLRMIYESEKAMPDFGIGLIHGAARHFGQKVFVGKRDLNPQQPGTVVEFMVKLLDD
jgi:hypothetical protein